jgi:MoaA/NifB/PqqE/SkfB family radical SAM enzyme
MTYQNADGSDGAMPAEDREPRGRFLAAVRQRAPRLDGLPTELTIELTSRCQLACVTCPRENLYRHLVANREMDWNLYERLARAYIPHLDYLSLAGGLGEPLLHSRFTDAVRLARSLNDGLYLSISTNALLPRTVRTLAPIAGLFTTIQVSMDSTGKQFDQIVGQADAFPVFERTVRQLVPLCAAAGTEMRFNCVVTPANVAALEDVTRTLASWGGRKLYFNGMNLVATRYDTAGYDFYVTPEYEARMNELVALGADLGLAVDWHNMRTINGFGSCASPWNNFYIGWNGVLPVCCAKPFPELLNFGHVEDGGLAARINDDALVEFRRLSVLNESPSFCTGCAAQHAWRGQPH